MCGSVYASFFFYRGKPARRVSGPYFSLYKVAPGGLCVVARGQFGRAGQLGAILCQYAAKLGQGGGQVGANAEATCASLVPACAKLAPQKRYKLVRTAPHGFQPHG